MDVFKKNRGNGRTSNTYYGKYKLPGMSKYKEINLGLTDKAAARSKYRRFLKELEQEQEGVIAPKVLREADDKPIVAHLKDFTENKSTTGCSAKHVGNISTYVLTVCNDCKWTLLKDIKADEFESWRTKQDKTGKTLNDYLSGWNNFCKWLVSRNRMRLNPFNNVERISTRRREDNRRALTLKEAQRLLSVCTNMKWKAAYMLALYCGLRRNEVITLKWSDIDIDSDNPRVRLRSINTKNGLSANLPLVAPLVQFLKEHRKTSNNKEYVTGSFSKMEKLKKDWEKANIPYKDAQGRIANFHCLRRTLCTMLHNAGVPQRVAQEIMRHSDPRLTAMVYTDSSCLDIKKALDSLPDLSSSVDETEGAAHIEAHGIALEGQNLTLSVKNDFLEKNAQVVGTAMSCHGLSTLDNDKKMVGVAGFEPATLWSQTKCASQTALYPDLKLRSLIIPYIG